MIFNHEWASIPSQGNGPDCINLGTGRLAIICFDSVSSLRISAIRNTRSYCFTNYTSEVMLQKHYLAKQIRCFGVAWKYFSWKCLIMILGT